MPSLGLTRHLSLGTNLGQPLDAGVVPFDVRAFDVRAEELGGVKINAGEHFEIAAEIS